jgi:hypothetical protein
MSSMLATMAAAASSERRRRAAGRRGGSTRTSRRSATQGPATASSRASSSEPANAPRRGRLQVAPEAGAQGRVGARGERGLELRAALADEVGGALLGVHGDQARELQLAVDGGTLLGQGGTLFHHVGRVGRLALVGRRAQALQAQIHVGQVGGAQRGQPLGGGADGVDPGDQLAPVVVFAELRGDGVELPAQLVHVGRRGLAVGLGGGRLRRRGRRLRGPCLRQAGQRAG